MTVHAEQLSLERPNAQTALPGFLTCQRCGTSDADVISYRGYVGGGWHERFVHCTDSDTCWARCAVAP